MQQRDVQKSAHVAWYKSPILLGIAALALCALLYVYIAVV
jgi:hypothetical protein